MKEWIIAGIVSFVGSGTFYAIVKALAGKIFKNVNKKVAELEKKNKINEQQVAIYKEYSEKLQNKVENLSSVVFSLVESINTYIGVDNEKKAKIEEVINQLFGENQKEEKKEEIPDEEKQID